MAKELNKYSEKEIEDAILRKYPNSFSAARIKLRKAFYDFFTAIANQFKGPE